MAEIFVSYKRENKDKVFPLVTKIEKETGCECWVDIDGIESSLQFASVICQAIEKAKVVLFMYSSVHLTIDFEKDWTVKELYYAHAKNKKVVLVKLDDAPLDNLFLLEYGTKNNIDADDPLQLQKLVKDLKSWTAPSLPPQIHQDADCHGQASINEHNVPPDSVQKPVHKTWRVGDYYNADGKEGIVFWVDETARHGKIVSMDEADLPWCTEEEWENNLILGASATFDGMKNLISIMQVDDWRNKYPAFAWCEAHGVGWYLPAIEEMKMLFHVKDILFFLQLEFYYWSSSELEDWAAWGIAIEDGDVSDCCRDNYAHVRAVAVF